MKKKILIIEDDPMIMKVIQMILDEYELLIAIDGISGIKIAEENRPDLILMDLTLPCVDGYEVLQEIRKFAETLPVIAMSAQKIPSSELIEKGFNDYLEKPFTPDTLLRKVGFFFYK